MLLLKSHMNIVLNNLLLLAPTCVRVLDSIMVFSLYQLKDKREIKEENDKSQSLGVRSCVTATHFHLARIISTAAQKF